MPEITTLTDAPLDAHQDSDRPRTPINELSQTQLTPDIPQNGEEGKAKKRRKHRKRPQRHSPGYYEELRQEKKNQQREQKWNARFTNEPIPELPRRRVQTTAKKTTMTLKRTRSPMNGKLAEQYKLPFLKTEQKLHSKTSNTAVIGDAKSFKIRSVKKDSWQRKESQEVRTLDVEKSLREVKVDPKELFLERLQKVGNSRGLQTSLRQMLTRINNNLNQKRDVGVRKEIQKELEAIATSEGQYDVIMKHIHDRKALLEVIRKDYPNVEGSLLSQYQRDTLGLVEDILKYKDHWETLLRKIGQTGKQPFEVEGKNYLLVISTDASFLEVDGKADPFMIKLASKVEQGSDADRKELMLKIRACELLFLEEAIGELK